MSSKPGHARGTETIKLVDTSQRQERIAVESVNSGTSLPGSNSGCCGTFTSYLTALCLSLHISKVQILRAPLPQGGTK